MFEVLPESTEDCLGFKVSGKLTAEDYAELLPQIDEAIAAQGQINMLVLIDHLEGWEGKDAAKADYEYEQEMLCFAESRDGIQWDRPDLGLVEYHGSTANNIIIMWVAVEATTLGSAFLVGYLAGAGTYLLQYQLMH